MESIAVNCHQCGGPLQVQAEASYVTCGFCDCTLRIECDGETRWTVALKRLDKTTEALTGDVGSLSGQLALERLEREWHEERRQYLIRGETEPFPGSMAVMGVVGTVFLAMIPIVVGGGPSMWPVALMYACLSGATTIRHMKLSDNLKTARGQYEDKKRRLIADAESEFDNRDS